MSSEFDRVRPRSPRPVSSINPVGHDAQGKRALFSSTGRDRNAWRRVGTRRVLALRRAHRAGPRQGVRAAMLPSLHLGLRIGHGDDVRSISMLKHDYPTYMRCPACGRPSWVRLTLQV